MSVIWPSASPTVRRPTVVWLATNCARELALDLRPTLAMFDGQPIVRHENRQCFVARHCTVSRTQTIDSVDCGVVFGDDNRLWIDQNGGHTSGVKRRLTILFQPSNVSHGDGGVTCSVENGVVGAAMNDFHQNEQCRIQNKHRFQCNDITNAKNRLLTGGEYSRSTEQPKPMTVAKNKIILFPFFRNGFHSFEEHSLGKQDASNH